MPTHPDIEPYETGVAADRLYRRITQPA